MTGKGSRAAGYVAGIREAIGHIRTFSATTDFSAFSDNRLLRDAVLHNFGVIGEAAAWLTRDCAPLVAQHPEIPWKAIVEMRHHLASRYFLIDSVVVWDTMQRTLPVLDRQMQDLQLEIDGRLA